MSLTPGTRIGSYEVIAALGAGGMGEVYRARDTRLGRDVALKILPEVFASDRERLARFEREAQVLASLNHPHIAAIHGLEESNGIRALVLEFVDGETLADRIARGPISLDEALEIAKQIAEALEAAHEQGIIHRDLKPANIKVRPDGAVKVLDFGLAKLAAPTVAAANAGASMSPTITSPALRTGVGVLLGTAAYMSPEQARGREADRRSDIWAFGCVLYEMLAGKRPFGGDDVSETLAGVIKSEPDWKALPIGLPQSVSRLLRRCLAKEPRHRLSDAAVARLEIDEPELQPTLHIPSRRSRERAHWIAHGAWVLIVVTAAALWAVLREGPRPEVRLDVTTPVTSDAASFALSPDGKRIVYVGASQDRPRVWLRDLGATTAVPLNTTDNAHLPFWSPDGDSIGFFSDQKLVVLNIAGKSQRTLATAQAEGLGGSWNKDDVVLYAPTAVGPLMRVSATGGAPSVATRLHPGERAHVFPEFLPDGRHFLYYVVGPPEVRGVYVGELDALDGRRLLDADAAGVPVSTGHLLFVRQGTVFMQRFDPARATVSGMPSPIAANVAMSQVRRWRAAISATPTGQIAFRSAAVAAHRQLTWLDRGGRELERVGDPDLVESGTVTVSADSTRLAFPRSVNGNADVWSFAMGRRMLERVTFDPALDSHPLWSPDSRQLVFQRFHDGAGDLMITSADGDRRESVLLANGDGNVATDWTRDSRVLLFKATSGNRDAGRPGSLTGVGRWRIWAMAMAGDRQPFLVLNTPFDERDGQFSRDGRWIAYSANDSGQFEIYVQPFPRGPKVRVSAAGGAQVRWRADNEELFYLDLDGRLMSVPIHLDAEKQTVDFRAAAPLFLTHIGPAVNPVSRQQYSVSPDGKRFLMNVITGDETTEPITLVLNSRTLAVR